MTAIPRARLRVLHVTPYGAGAWAYGGIPRVVDSLTCGLAARGHQVTVCTTDACDGSGRLRAASRSLRPWPAFSDAPGLTVRVFPNVSNRAAYHQQAFLPLGLRSYLRRHAHTFDVAHLHACRNLPGLMAARQLRRAGVPYVVAPNGTAPRLERKQRTKLLVDLCGGNRMLRDAAMVLAVSAAEIDQLMRMGISAERIRTVPNPLDEIPADAVLRNGSADTGARAPVVMFLGKLTPRKRLDVLIHAFDRLRADPRFACASLMIAGNDMGAGSAARGIVASLRLDSHVRFAGLLTGSMRFEALSTADVVVYPSEDEIFGLVPLEALLAGTPVVVSNDSGCGEVISSVEGGLLVEPGSVEGLRYALERVLSAPFEWRIVARQAATRARRLYGRARVCALLEQAYLDAIAGAGRTAGRPAPGDPDVVSGFSRTRRRRPSPGRAHA